MAHTPQYDRRLLRKLGVIDENKFFQTLSEKAGYMDPETAKAFYMALVRTVTEELRNKGFSRLPHLGDFFLLQQKPKPLLAGRSESGQLLRRLAPAMKILKFYPTEAWRKYFAFREITGLPNGDADGTQV